MSKFVEDELEEMQPNKAPQAATQTATASSKQAPQVEELDAPDEGVSAKPNVNTDDVDFGDEELMKNEGLTKLLPEKGKTVRTSILDFVKPKKGYSHYINGKGTFRCLSARDAKGNITEQAACCEKLGDADLVIAALCLHYTNAPSKDGKYTIIKGEDGKAKYKEPIEWDVKWLKLSRSGYRAVSALPPEELARSWAKADDAVTVYDIDFTIGWRNAQGGGFNYNYAGKARWRTNPALVEEVKAACKPFMDGKRLTQKLGRVATLLELKAAMSGTSAEADDAQLGDLGDM